MANPKINERPLSTTIPLYDSRPCPGLRPANIDDLDLVKEDIGLKQPIITRDYPSPTEDNIRYEGAPITTGDAANIKVRIENKVWKNNKEVGQQAEATDQRQKTS